MTNQIMLLPRWETVPGKTGLTELGSGRTMPAVFKLNAAEYDPQAIPTPFARAEAMRLVLSEVEIPAPPEARLKVEYTERFRLMTLGVVSGVLTVEPDDLASARYDDLGAALLQVEPRSRYFCHLRMYQGESYLTYGITHRNSIFAPHARRLSRDWDDLAEAVKPHQVAAIGLLQEWVDRLKRAGRWTPDALKCEWQRGLRSVLAHTGASVDTSGRRAFDEDCRFVGPVTAWLPTGTSDGAVSLEPIYLPTHHPGFTRRFVSSLQFQPHIEPGGDVVLNGPGNRELWRIRVHPASASTDIISLGSGRLSLTDEPLEKARVQEDWVNGTRDEDGLVQMLEPLTMALGRLENRRTTDATNVLKCPFLYPDPIRLLFGQGLWRDSGAVPIRESSSLRTAWLESPVGPLTEDAVEEAGGVAVRVGVGGEHESIVFYLDFLGDQPVLDLRAMGYLLWRVFVGTAVISDEAGGTPEILDTESYERLLRHQPDRPLEPVVEIYGAVRADAPDDLSQRLATMQRFVKAYPRADGGLPRLLAAAARSFCSWATGRDGVAPLGRGPRGREELVLPTGDRLAIAIDGVGPVIGG